MHVPNPVVVVPVHRFEPTIDEKYSIRRCGQVLAGHPICFVHPADLHLEPYLALIPTASSIPVPSEWMESIRAYNRMMVNPSFYARFSGYSHLLIHEPDALVLSDRLIWWCQQPYDYIGAPWFEDFDAATPESCVIGVGNSGFSLMRLSAISTVLMSGYRWLPYLQIFRQLVRKLFRRSGGYSSHCLLRSLGTAGLLSGAYHVMEDNFDTFLCQHIPRCAPDFLIAPLQAALAFSWEVNPRVCLKLNHNRPPFGLHAWPRYDRAFVETLIDFCS